MNVNYKNGIEEKRIGENLNKNFSKKIVHNKHFCLVAVGNAYQ